MRNFCPFLHLLCWWSCVPCFIEIWGKMWATCASLSIFAPLALISVRAETSFVVNYHLCIITWRSFVLSFIEIGAKMRAACAFLSIFAPFALISARCARGNQFCCKISFVHHDLEIMCTKFHWDRRKNMRCTRISLHFCAYGADFRELRARKPVLL